MLANLILPEIKVSVTRDKKYRLKDLYQVNSSFEIAEVFKWVFDQDTIDFTEEAVMLCLNRANKVLGWFTISKGGMTGTVMDPRVVITIAMNMPGTTSIAIAHNHPFGNLKPSSADEEITKKIKEAVKYFDIRLLDHVIISDDSYFSFADEGIL